MKQTNGRQDIAHVMLIIDCEKSLSAARPRLRAIEKQMREAAAESEDRHLLVVSAALCRTSELD